MLMNYENVPLEELRSLLLSGELVHEKMQEEDYSILMDNEFERAEPDNEVIRLCTVALRKYESYSELSNIKIDIDELIKQSGLKIVTSKNRKLKKAAVIFAAAIAAMFITQAVAMAMGYDLLGYVFKRDGDILSIENAGDIEDELFDEPVYTTYETIGDMPDDIVALLPFDSLEGFDFFFGSTMFYSPGQYHAMFGYLLDGNEEVFVTLEIKFGIVDAHLPIDEDFFEEYVVNGNRYSIYRNLEMYKVVWVDNGLLYDMSVNLPLDEVKSIIDNFR